LLAGAWGARAGELLERASERRGASVYRTGELAMFSPPQFIEGSWCCWLFGDPEDRGTLAARFGHRPNRDLAAAFIGALAELGEAACEFLCGRFAVVILDRERERCIVARDQLGAQPLVHVHLAGGVLFAQHERDLLELLPRTPGPDRLALLQWIENGLIPQGRTLYEGVRSLPAGHQLILEGQRVSVTRWWNLSYQGIEGGTERLLAERLRGAAFAAIGRAVSGSQRPAVKLSGGLDSACVAAGLQANGFTDGRSLAVGGTFSAYSETDESELIRATARHTHLPLELIAFNSDRSMLAPALAHIARWRLPPITPNLFLWQPVMARARERGVDLMLDGEGGDELFGLAPYLIADVLRAGRLHTAWSLTRAIPLPRLEQNRDWRIRLRLLRRYGLSPLLPTDIRRYRDKRAIAGSSGSIIPRADAQALADLHMASQEDRRDGPLWWQFLAKSLIDTRDLLGLGAHFRREAADEDIERRHPFLYDLHLTEAALRFPPRAQFDPVRDRLLLREGLNGLIPEAVRTRHVKIHFTPLVLAGIRADESGLIDPLRRADAPVRAYIAPEALDRKIGMPPDDRSMLGAGSLWQVAIANRWLTSQTSESS
jgi:asparagine synthase (glutamine-hydrolysing)